MANQISLAHRVTFEGREVPVQSIGGGRLPDGSTPAIVALPEPHPVYESHEDPLGRGFYSVTVPTDELVVVGLQEWAQKPRSCSCNNVEDDDLADQDFFTFGTGHDVGVI